MIMKILKEIKRICEEFVYYAGPGVSYFLLVLSFWVAVISTAIFTGAV